MVTKHFEAKDQETLKNKSVPDNSNRLTKLSDKPDLYDSANTAAHLATGKITGTVQSVLDGVEIQSEQ